MTPEKLLKELKEGINQWNQRWEGVANTDPTVVRQMSREMEEILLWAMGRLIDILDKHLKETRNDVH